jgi:hypothetical protein
MLVGCGGQLGGRFSVAGLDGGSGTVGPEFAGQPLQIGTRLPIVADDLSPWADNLHECEVCAALLGEHPRRPARQVTHLPFGVRRPPR